MAGLLDFMPPLSFQEATGQAEATCCGSRVASSLSSNRVKLPYSRGKAT
jgi:hypothetical protein